MRVTINLRLDAEDRKAFALIRGMEKFDESMFRAWAKSLVETAMGNIRSVTLGEGHESDGKEET